MLAALPPEVGADLLDEAFLCPAVDDGFHHGRLVVGQTQCHEVFFRKLFGEDIEKAMNGDGARIGTRGPRNLLELLPDEFTLEDAKRVRQQQGMGNDAHKAMKMIRTWMNRGYVIQNTEYSFQKRTT